MDKSKISKIKILPPKIDTFVGRTTEMVGIINAINRHRFVSVSGISGIGKSAIIKNIANLLSDREIIQNGVIYLDIKNIANIENFIEKLY
jgi:ABC-type dipeptide/oligopeptide/nickel transport system ATPase component